TIVLLAPPRRPTRSTLFPYTTLFRSLPCDSLGTMAAGTAPGASCGGGLHSPPTRRLTAGGPAPGSALGAPAPAGRVVPRRSTVRSEEHTSELQSRGHLVCRLLLEKKK